ncbi:MAG: hypothetical protein QG635_34 [Bacteroidota bacterium]|nr:hypothetical protein [Bacteroidota bacterium]
MKIINLQREHEKLYFCCLEDWSDEIKEAGNHKEQWFEKMRHSGIRVKLATDVHGAIGGMIQYMPVEHSFAEGKDSYIILCIWVHGYKEGRGNFQKKGMGSALLQAAEEDVKSIGGKGIAAWGIALPFFMKASWFRKHGYRTVDKDGMIRLLWKPFNEIAIPPKLIKKKKKPEKITGKVNLSLFINGWCPAQNLVYERAIKAAQEFGDKVVINEYRTDNREILNEWGISDAFFIDNKEVRTGPPPSFEKIRKKIQKKVKRL